MCVHVEAPPAGAGADVFDWSRLTSAPPCSMYASSSGVTRGSSFGA